MSTKTARDVFIPEERENVREKITDNMLMLKERAKARDMASEDMGTFMKKAEEWNDIVKETVEFLVQDHLYADKEVALQIKGLYEDVLSRFQTVGPYVHPLEEWSTRPIGALGVDIEYSCRASALSSNTSMLLDVVKVIATIIHAADQK